MKIPTPILYVMIAILAFLAIQQCSIKNNAQRQQDSVVNYLKDSLEHYTNKQGLKVSQIEALQGDKENLKVLLSETSSQLNELAKKFNQVDAAVEIKTVTQIDTFFVPYEKPVDQKFSRQFLVETNHYTISGTASNLGVGFNSIVIPDTLSFVIGKKSIGFWKNEYRIEAVHSNPYVKTKGLDAYSYKTRKKRLGLSLYAGYGLSSNFTFEAQIGIGLTFDLIRF